MVLSMFLSFFSCALFAQNQQDTVPQPQKTDTLKTDTNTNTTTDTTKKSAFIQSTHFMNRSSISNGAWALPATENTVYANTPKNRKGATHS